MANSVTLRKLYEGPRHLIVMAKFNIDTTAEISDSVFVDPVGSGTCDPVPVLVASQCLTVEQIWGSISSMAVVLEFDAATDTPIWVVSSGNSGEWDFRPFGGIRDASGATPTGKIQITTIGATANVSTGSIILKIRKD